MRRAMDNLLGVRGSRFAHLTRSHMVISISITVLVHPDRIVTPAKIFHALTSGESSLQERQ
ncbi:hypothetical protein LQ51_04145 [Micromonospora sp. HK10]|nr:hypothetical protein LQ51_04145 [Micromonospora sp. HK10]